MRKTKNRTKRQQWYAGPRAFNYGGVWVKAKEVEIPTIIQRLKKRLTTCTDLLKAGRRVTSLVVSGEANCDVYNPVRKQLLEALGQGLTVEMVVGPIISWDPQKGNAIIDAASQFPKQFTLYFAPLREEEHFALQVVDDDPVLMVGEIPHPPLQEEFRESFHIPPDDEDPDGKNPEAIAAALAIAHEEFKATKAFCQRLRGRQLQQLLLRLKAEKIRAVQNWWEQRERHFDTLTLEEIEAALKALDLWPPP